MAGSRNPSSDTKSKLAGKDWVTLMFSASALLVSALSFYFTNVLVNDSVVVRLVGVHSMPGDTSVYADRAPNNGVIVAEFAFANTGNRPAVLVAAEYRIGDTGDLGDRAVGHSVRLNLVLPPREVHVGEIHISVEVLVGNMKNGKDLGENMRRFFAAYGFSTVDSGGFVHETKATRALVQIDVTSTGWSTFGKIPEVEKFPMTKLFQNESAFALWMRKSLGLGQ